MRISFSTINRILEEKAATDEAFRNTLARKGKVLLVSGRALSAEALLDKLASLGLRIDREVFLRGTRSFLSAQQMAEAVYDDMGERLREEDKDWVWIAFTCLWERWSPEHPSLKMIDDWMQEGYKAQDRGDQPAVCRLWLKTWKSILAIVEARQLRSVEEFDELFCGSNSLFNWVQGFLRALHNAGLADKAFHQERLAVLEALLGRLQLGSLLANLRNYLAETYFFLGMPEKAEQLYRRWLEETPRWGWGWIGWADGYSSCIPDEERDPARAEQILKQGLAIPDVDNRRYLLDRLRALYEGTGQAREAKTVAEEIEQRKPDCPAPPAAEALPRTVGRRDGKEMPARFPRGRVQPTTARRVGRNDPCPCGSGKKFKNCCRRG